MKRNPSFWSLASAALAACLFFCAAPPTRAAIDLNSDGVSDVWEILYPGAGDPDADPDGDGVINRLESLWASNPLRPDRPSHGFSVSFNPVTDSLEISWPGKAGKRYQLHSRTNFADADWAPDGDPVDGTGTMVVISRPVSSLGTMYRLQVSDRDSSHEGVTQWEATTIRLDRHAAKGGTGGAITDPDPVITARTTRPYVSEDEVNGQATTLPGVFILQRSGVAGVENVELMVGYTISGTADTFNDHAMSNRWVSLPPGVSSYPIDLRLKRDNNGNGDVVEAGESVTLAVTWVLRIDYDGGDRIPTSIPVGSPNRATVIINNTAAANGTGLRGQYYDTASATYLDPANFNGVPAVDRTDATVDFNWLYGTPNGNTALTSPDNYSVSWEGYLSPTTATDYHFQLDADDKARVFLNNVQILENGWDSPRIVGFKQTTTSIPLVIPATPGARYHIRVEFAETTGDATCRLQWKVGTANFADIPAANVFRDDQNPTTGWNASYFNNTALTPPAAVTQFDTQVTSGNGGIWGSGTPDVNLIGRDTFSVRWTGQVQPQFSEEYTFVVNSDDGAKLWVNGQPLTLLRADNNAVIDWNSTTTTADRYARISLIGGVRYDIRLEYFENTGSAKCQLSWYSPSQPKQIIPSTRLYPGNGTIAPPTFTGETDATALVGGLFTYALTGNNGATVSISGKPSWLTFSGGVLSGTPPSGAAGEYQILITTTSGAGTGTSVLNLRVTNTGSTIVREHWSGVTGTSVADIPVSTTPTGTGNLSSLEAPTNFGDDYGARIRGYITAPVTGNYYFWIAANNSAELWISNDEEPVNAFKRAWVASGSTTPQTWNAEANQKSPWMALEAGKKYYIEILHKAGTGAGDNLAVGWAKPGQATTAPSQVVPGFVLSTYVPPAPGSTPGTLYIATLLAQSGADTVAVGKATMRLNEGETIAYITVKYSGLTGAQDGAPPNQPAAADGTTAADGVIDPTDWHVHSDPYLTHQSYIIFDGAEPLVGDGPQFDGQGNFVNHKWNIISQGTLSVANIRELIKQGKAYINLHTALYPGGEIRGNFTLANGSRTFTPPPPAPSWTDDHTTDAGAVRFLTQATFGPNIADIAALKAMASYEAWIDDQFTKPASQQLPEVLARELSDANGGSQFSEALTFNAWWRNSITGPDQLRQRIAFALSEIHVVSAQGPLDNNARGLSHFYDTLAGNAFGNFRNLIQDTTLTPAMGRYLDMWRNDKPDLTVGRIPNENYAREIKQLFSIGLYRMWPDGTLILNSKDEPIDTYTQREIVGISHVFTGWDYGYDGAFRTALNAPTDWTRFMREVPARHFTGPKRILNNEVLPGLPTVGGQPLDPYATHAAGQYNDPTYQALPAQELDVVHDQLFDHPNTGPFICRQLIQRLVTSHPSRDYLYRVVQKFSDNGSGVRGDMKAVIKAILLDYEARSSVEQTRSAFGKQREPVMRVAAAARAFRTEATTGTYSQSGSHVITITAPNKLAGGRTVFLEFPKASFTPGDNTPTSEEYRVLSTPVPTATAFSVNAKGWAGVSNSTAGTSLPDVSSGVIGKYSQSAGSTVMTITLSGHWLPAGGKAWLDFGDVTGGTAMTDGVYIAASSDSTTGGGSTFTITEPNTTAKSGFVRMVGFQGSFTVSNNTGGPVGQEKRITLDTTAFNSGNQINDHHLVVGNSVFLNFTRGNPQPLDGEFVIESVPDANTFTVLTSTAIATPGGGNNDGDNGMWMFPLVSQPLTRGGQPESVVKVSPGTFNLGSTDSDLDQTPLNSPTVFNFFLPDYKFPGALASQGLTTPEFQGTAETTVIRQENFLYNGIFNPGDANGISSFKSGSHALMLDFSPWMGNATTDGLGVGPQPTEAWTSNANLATLIDHLNTLLGAQLSVGAQTVIQTFVVDIGNIGYTNGSPTDTQKRNRLRAIVHLIITSPDFTIQR